MVGDLAESANVFLIFVCDHVGADGERQLVQEDLAFQVAGFDISRDQGQDLG